MQMQLRIFLPCLLIGYKCIGETSIQISLTSINDFVQAICSLLKIIGKYLVTSIVSNTWNWMKSLKRFLYWNSKEYICMYIHTHTHTHYIYVFVWVCVDLFLKFKFRFWTNFNYVHPEKKCKTKDTLHTTLSQYLMSTISVTYATVIIDWNMRWTEMKENCLS